MERWLEEDVERWLEKDVEWWLEENVEWWLVENVERWLRKKDLVAKKEGLGGKFAPLCLESKKIRPTQSKLNTHGKLKYTW